MSFFFFNDTATTEIYTLSLHDALPISNSNDWTLIAVGEGGTTSVVTWTRHGWLDEPDTLKAFVALLGRQRLDRKSTRLNSSHPSISYAVFCLKKKKKIKIINNDKDKTT